MILHMKRWKRGLGGKGLSGSFLIFLKGAVVMNFKEGDIVRLASGGPVMTVIQENDVNHVECGWFDNTTYRKDHFSKNSLVNSSNDNDRQLEESIFLVSE